MGGGFVLEEVVGYGKTWGVIGDWWVWSERVVVVVVGDLCEGEVEACGHDVGVW